MKRKTKTVSTTIDTREDLERRVGEYAATAARLAEIEAEMNLKLADVRKDFESRISDLSDSAGIIFEDIQAFCSLHPEEFQAGRKSIELLHGTVGFRTGMPRLTMPRGRVEEELCSEMLPLPSVGKFVRRTYVVDRSAVIGALTTPSDDESKKVLDSLGFKVSQAERFYIDPKFDEVEA